MDHELLSKSNKAKSSLQVHVNSLFSSIHFRTSSVMFWFHRVGTQEEVAVSSGFCENISLGGGLHSRGLKNICVRGWDPKLWLFKWKLQSSTLKWYCLFCSSEVVLIFRVGCLNEVQLRPGFRKSPDLFLSGLFSMLSSLRHMLSWNCSR